MTSDPLHMDDLDPERVAQAINLSRRAFDYIIIDLHPSYGPLNQAIFREADQIFADEWHQGWYSFAVQARTRAGSGGWSVWSEPVCLSVR